MNKEQLTQLNLTKKFQEDLTDRMLNTEQTLFITNSTLKESMNGYEKVKEISFIIPVPLLEEKGDIAKLVIEELPPNSLILLNECCVDISADALTFIVKYSLKEESNKENYNF